MKNYQKLYTRLMREMDEGFDRDQRYEIYEGSDEDIIYIEDLDSQCTRLQQRIMDGAQCVLKHVAFAEDLEEMGMNATVGDDIYLMDSPTDSTQPAFVLSWSSTGVRDAERLNIEMNDINNINNLFRGVIQEQSEEPRYNNSMKERIEWLIDYYIDMRNEAEADQHSNPFANNKQIDMCEEFIQDLKDLHKELWYNKCMKAAYRKLNDGSLNSSTYHKKDGTNVRAKLKAQTRKEELKELWYNNSMTEIIGAILLCGAVVGMVMLIIALSNIG